MTHTITCESVPGHPDFRRLESIPGVRVDLRYASPDNFVGRDLYSPLDCAWLHRQAAEGLGKSFAWLSRQRNDLGFLVLDAMRPQRVQEQLWSALEGTDLQMYLANPVRGSIHSFGMAVDITLIDLHGNELDMGTPFDDLTDLSHPAKEAEFLAGGLLTRMQVDHRHLLREAMAQGGFAGINTEWWHFDCGDRLQVRAEFARIL
jgi:D-alanyl-D-alanine dipeptidase